MPDDRLARAQGTLPPGYQFGDMRHHGRIAIRFIRQWDIRCDTHPIRMDDWRPPSENAAARIARYQTEYETGRDCGDERAE